MFPLDFQIITVRKYSNTIEIKFIYNDDKNTNNTKDTRTIIPEIDRCICSQ